MTGPVGSDAPEAASGGPSGGVGIESDPSPTAFVQQRPDGEFDVGSDVDTGHELESDGGDLLEDPRDWAWVEEWRRGGEPVPWGPGVAVAGFTLIVVASAVYVLSAGLSDRPVVAIAVNLLVAAGLGPALWLSRGLPVLRWIAAGAVAGVLAAWLCVFIFLV